MTEFLFNYGVCLCCLCTIGVSSVKDKLVSSQLPQNTNAAVTARAQVG